MSKTHAVGVALALSAAGSLMLACSDRPTEPSAHTREAPAPSMKRDHSDPTHGRAALLKNIPVSGTIVGGGTFAGTLTATHMSIDPVTRQLRLDGVLNGTATTATGVVTITDQPFTAADMALSREASTTGLVRPASMQASCDVLFLDLGPLHLDLLGLTIDLAEVILDVNAVTGGGNLLGNLLCALLGLLDVAAIIGTIQQILDTINNLLAGVSNPGVGGAAAAWIAPALASVPFLRST